MRTISIRSWLGVGAGAVIALALPISTWILGLGLGGVAMTVEQVRLRDIAIEQARPFADLISSTALAELLLGPIGVVIAGRSAGVHGTIPWLVLVAATIPVLAIVWLLGLLTMSGALGSPL